LTADGWIIASWALAGGLLLPAGVFCAQCLASLLPPRRKARSIDESSAARPRVAVLTPAHNEERTLGPTLAALRPQLSAGDVSLVVADNCDDGTADVARDHGVEVVERYDAARRGKGYALAYGVAALQSRAYEVLVVLDADCRLEPGAIDALARQVAATGRPAQAVYLMQPCDRPTPRDQVSTLAFTVKNQVRPTGLHRLGLPVPLTGTGMAFPREALRDVTLGSANIVEDMQLGLDLALAGRAPRLCPAAQVVGQLPTDARTALGQRRRWEHGHIRTIVTQVPRLLGLGLIRCKPAAWAMALDLLVPPLSLLLVLLLLAGGALAGIAAMTRVTAGPAIALFAAFAAVIGSVFLVWLKFGRQMLPASSLSAVASYVAWKLPLYAAVLLRPEKKWVRTDRASAVDLTTGPTPLPDPAKSAA
jgi:cellulose synthase/poly-beta-1,6-N-acetylglucosamine synthase-like glycosyltransferase